MANAPARGSRLRRRCRRPAAPRRLADTRGSGSSMATTPARPRRDQRRGAGGRGTGMGAGLQRDVGGGAPRQRAGLLERDRLRVRAAAVAGVAAPGHRPSPPRCNRPPGWARPARAAPGKPERARIHPSSASAIVQSSSRPTASGRSSDTSLRSRPQPGNSCRRSRSGRRRRCRSAPGLHHYRADRVRRDVGLAHRFQPPHDTGDHLVEPLALDRPLLHGDPDRALELAAVERLAPPALLDHHQVAQLHPLVGGERPPHAGQNRLRRIDTWSSAGRLSFTWVTCCRRTDSA